MNAKSTHWEACREAREMESPPPPTRGHPGEFRDDCRKQARILKDLRAFRDQTIRERQEGTWQAPGLVPLAPKKKRGKSLYETIPG